MLHKFVKDRRLARWLTRLGFVAVVLLLLGTCGISFLLLGSRAQLDGARKLQGLSASVTVERDKLGVPRIRATNRVDATRALGFIHAQERFFQMDLSRRAGGGELAELFGPAALRHDLAARVHRPRTRARQALAAASHEDRALILAYAQGVNTGLKALWTRPPEYLLLNRKPRPWAAEDVFLVAYAMFDDLHDTTGLHDYKNEVFREAFPPKAVKFFTTPDASWSAALDDSRPTPAEIPSAEEVDFSHDAPADGKPSDAEKPARGSNSWAVDGARSTTGSAIVANDMHLSLRVPNTWYRARLTYTSTGLHDVDVTGVTLPGTPVVVSGSNGHIAWANTASHLDVADLIELRLTANGKGHETGNGTCELASHIETIKVRGETNRTLRMTESIWGPVVKHGDRMFALVCVRNLPDGLNMGLVSLETAADLEAAMHFAKACGTPLNNIVIGDTEGAIGYTLLGRIPRRSGFDGSLPVSWSDGAHPWSGWLGPAEYPEWTRPPNGVIWTANNRILGSKDYLALSPTGQDNGARAQQIRDALLFTNRFSESDLWSIYHDDRALFMKRWHHLLLETLDAQRGDTDTQLPALRTALEGWQSRASVESPGFGIVRVFRAEVLNLLFEPVNRRLAKLDQGISIRNEEAGWRMLEERPRHLLNPRFGSYDDLLAEAIRRINFTGTAWGVQNRTAIRHPLSRAVPQLARWLDMPDRPMSGAPFMPKVHEPGFGVSQRMIVSPGHETNGLFNMPGGQSGHFLSPFYRAEFEAWWKAEPTPFLPGPVKYTLTLLPM